MPSKIPALLLVIFFMLSCKKDEPKETVIPPGIDSNEIQYGTPFAGVPDAADAVIYQVNIRAFSSAGNFAGVTERLDSIRALGVNVVYLMPVYPIGNVNSVNSPYCVKNYTLVNPEFGTLNDLRMLVDSAHAKGMSIMLDWVANHTAWDNPWITAHPDWYLQDGSGNIVSPPNTTYLDVAQLNFDTAEMRLAMIDSMKYWVYASNIDGFRFDYADSPPSDFWTQVVDSLRNITTHKLLLLAEGKESGHYTSGFDYIFGFNFYTTIKSVYNNSTTAANLGGLNISEYNGASPGQKVVRYITNHDVNGSDGTPVSVFGGHDAAMSAFVIAACMKGVPMIYNGQEVGMTTAITFPFTSVNVNWSLNPGITAEYKALIALYNDNTALRNGEVTMHSSFDVCAFTKVLNSDTVFVMVNVRSTSETYTIPSNLANSSWTNSLTGESVFLNDTFDLAPYDYFILEKP